MNMRHPARARKNATIYLLVLAAGTALCGFLPVARADDSSEAAVRSYRSPWAIAVAPDGKTVYVSDATARCVAILDAAGMTKRSEIALEGAPRGLCLSPDGATLYVAERGAGTVAVVDTASARVVGRLAAGRWPVAVALASKSRRLLVCNQDRHTLSVWDLSATPPAALPEVLLVREPSSAVVTPDERFAVVTNQLPLGRSTDPMLAAEVSVVNLETLAVSATVKLPPGSSLVNGVCASPDGKWAYAVHGLGHFNLPMTQLERGWVNTYALSIIDIAQGKRLATVLLDDLMQGAADPFAVVCSPDGGRLWVSHTGVHEISTIEIARVHELLNGPAPDDVVRYMDGSLPNIWVRIQQDRALIEELSYDLTALYLAGAIRRTPSGGKGPRGIALTADGKTLFVANYFSGAVSAIAADSGRGQGEISLGAQPPLDEVRRGELLFHDATACFQRWHSCASCHPNDGRIDGLRWDFADDGLGNGMNTPPILVPHETEPLHRQGALATTRTVAEHGLTFTHMIVPTEQQVNDLTAYLRSLRPESSPHRLAQGELTPAAKRGRALFEGRAECATCHNGPHFTDQKFYTVGWSGPNTPDAKFKTTPLLELHRTAPYMHDGSALSLEDVLTTSNSHDQHGKTSGLSAKEIQDLAAYLRSL